MSADTRRRDWHDLLADACAGHGLSTVYQPIVDLSRGTTVGYEALARFDSVHGADWVERNPQRWFDAARARRRHAELEAAALRSFPHWPPGRPCLPTASSPSTSRRT